jgi:hypothetical protein
VSPGEFARFDFLERQGLLNTKQCIVKIPSDFYRLYYEEKTRGINSDPHYNLLERGIQAVAASL